MKILVVDDELSMREYLEVLLARARLRGAHRGRGAAGRGRCSGPVRWTWWSPTCGSGKESGLERAQGTRGPVTRPPEVILITAYGTPASAVEAMRAGRVRLHLQALRQRGAEAAGAEGAGEARAAPGEPAAARARCCRARPCPWSARAPAMRDVSGRWCEKVARQRAPPC